MPALKPQPARVAASKAAKVSAVKPQQAVAAALASAALLVVRMALPPACLLANAGHTHASRSDRLHQTTARHSAKPSSTIACLICSSNT